MTIALWLMAAQGVLGAFDTVYYHEWRARLPARGRAAAAELKVHAARDFLYAVLFGTLPWIAWQGWWVAALAAVIVAEIVLTLTDFVIEIAVRKPLGDVWAGERVTHAVMGILYGGMAANLVPVMWTWWTLPTALIVAPAAASAELRAALSVMAVGVFLSGARDLYAAFELPRGNWPWQTPMSRTAAGGD